VGEVIPQTVRYAIDAGDVVRWVDDDFVAFAAANGAPDLTREQVVGRWLWDFVDGAATCFVWQLLFDRVRGQGVSLAVPFRCDSPDLLRVMELRLAPADEGGIEFTGVLLREQPRRHLSFLETGLPRMERTFPICSLCKRIFAFGEWLEVDRAAARLGLLEVERPPTLEQAVCEACAARCRAEARHGLEA
jgi:hypothetical protein